MDKNYFRNNSYMSRYASGRPKVGKGLKRSKNDLANTIANQFIVCAAICLVVLILSNFTNSYIVKLLGGVKWVVESDYDFLAAATGAKRFVQNFGTDSKDEPDIKEGLFGNTDAVDASSSSVLYMAMPADGEVTSNFGTREDPITEEVVQHMGIDIDGSIGAPIKAAMDGVVLKVDESETLGRFVRVMHSDGLETLYGHCSEILVDENQPVNRGDIIAKIGDTGVVTSSHLHFEVIKDGKQIDPLTMLESPAEPK